MVAVFKSVELAEKGWCPMSIPKILFVHEISISRKHFHIFFFFWSRRVLRDSGEAVRNVCLLSTPTG